MRSDAVAWPVLIALALAGAALLVPVNTTPGRTEDGLVVTTLARGSGPRATLEDRVEIEFVAQLASSGVVFDSTGQRGRTLSFDLANPGLIEGLRRGIRGMREGGRRRIEVPWRLGYGETGRPPIPPMADLVYDVRLVSRRPASR